MGLVSDRHGLFFRFVRMHMGTGKPRSHLRAHWRCNSVGVCFRLPFYLLELDSHDGAPSKNHRKGVLWQEEARQ